MLTPTLTIRQPARALIATPRLRARAAGSVIGEAMTRQQKINAILDAAQKPLPEIAKRYTLRDTESGRVYQSTMMVPYGRAGHMERHKAYYVLTDRDGSAYGTRHKTREAAKAEAKRHQQNSREEFRRALVAMTDEQIEQQAEYWLAATA